MRRVLEENWHLIEEMTEKLKELKPKPCEIILYGILSGIQ